MSRSTLLFLAASLLSAPALAQVSVTLPLGSDANVESVSFTCSDQPDTAFQVQYINSGANSLAILPVNGEERIFVNVVSASGARYVAGQFEWWTKGDTATLRDEISDAEAQDCATVN